MTPMQKPKLSFTLKGWEEGKPFLLEKIISPDRWAVQNANSVTLHFRGTIGDIEINQDPHSSELGGYLWLSGVLLVFYMEEECRRDLVKKIRCNRKLRLNTFLELGAGCSGVPTISLRRLGKLCIGTDIGALLPQLEENVKRNDSENSVFVREFPCAMELEWSSKNDSKLCHKVQEILKKYDCEGRLDVIVMADCIYSEASAEFLADTLSLVCQRAKSRFGTAPEIWCVSEVRNESAQEEFLNCSSAHFLIKSISSEEFQTPAPTEYRADFIRLYKLYFASYIL